VQSIINLKEMKENDLTLSRFHARSSLQEQNLNPLLLSLSHSN
jgi:hypothetical protein